MCWCNECHSTATARMCTIYTLCLYASFVLCITYSHSLSFNKSVFRQWCGDMMAVPIRFLFSSKCMRVSLGEKCLRVCLFVQMMHMVWVSSHNPVSPHQQLTSNPNCELWAVVYYTRYVHIYYSHRLAFIVVALTAYSFWLFVSRFLCFYESRIFSLHSLTINFLMFGV